MAKRNSMKTAAQDTKTFRSIVKSLKQLGGPPVLTDLVKKLEDLLGEMKDDGQQQSFWYGFAVYQVKK